tara:strand:- start:575 stop:754 length:180 start_codon:yes stop_codon:yes gene_type:complete
MTKQAKKMTWTARPPVTMYWPVLTVFDELEDCNPPPEVQKSNQFYGKKGVERYEEFSYR